MLGEQHLEKECDLQMIHALRHMQRLVYRYLISDWPMVTVTNMFTEVYWMHCNWITLFNTNTVLQGGCWDLWKGPITYIQFPTFWTYWDIKRRNESWKTKVSPWKEISLDYVDWGLISQYAYGTLASTGNILIAPSRAELGQDLLHIRTSVSKRKKGRVMFTMTFYFPQLLSI